VPAPTPTTLTVTYISTLPSTTSQVTVPIPTPTANMPLYFGEAVRNIFLQGGLWAVNSTGVNQFIPWSQISSITAQ
jgi:hypothetical protein